jgi:hypothetical protein
MKHLSIILLLACLGITACVGPPKGRKAVPRKPVVTQNDPNTRQCLADLSSVGARYSLVPDQYYGGGCSTLGSLALTATPVPTTNIKAIRCPLARNLALWVRDDVQAAARKWLGSKVVRVDSMGAYACRNIIGGKNGNQRSEHATANAVDIGGFLLADGRRLAVVSGWYGDEDERQFWRAVRAAGCKRFQTVLSPDYNAAHHDHLHFDMGRGPFCR